MIILQIYFESPKRFAGITYTYTTYRPPPDPLGPCLALALALVEEGLVNSLGADLIFPPGEVTLGGILRIPPGSTIVLITKIRHR